MAEEDNSRNALTSTILGGGTEESMELRAGGVGCCACVGG